MNMPIIRLDIENMKHSIIHALTEYEVQLCEDIKTAVDKYLQPNNIRNVINNLVSREIENVIKEEVEHFFRHGAGRIAIREAIVKKLSSE